MGLERIQGEAKVPGPTRLLRWRHTGREAVAVIGSVMMVQLDWSGPYCFSLRDAIWRALETASFFTAPEPFLDLAARATAVRLAFAAFPNWL